MILWRVLLAVTILLFLALAWTGFSGSLHQFSQATTVAQLLQSLAQLAFGVLGILSPAARFWAPQWSRPVFIGWVLSVALAGGLAPVVWAESSVLTGIVSGVASLLVAWGMVWLLRMSARRAA